MDRFYSKKDGLSLARLNKMFKAFDESIYFIEDKITREWVSMDSLEDYNNINSQVKELIYTKDPLKALMFVQDGLLKKELEMNT